MAKRDSAYRFLTKTGVEELGIDASDILPHLAFKDAEGLSHELRIRNDTKGFYIDDQEAEWDPNTHSLTVGVNFAIENAAVLFSGLNQVAYPTSEISVALFLVSPDSSDQRLIGICPIENIDERQNLSVNGVLGKGVYHGDIELIGYLVLTKPGAKEGGIFGINNTAGIKLGRLFSFLIRITGDGTSFPVFEQPSETNGLWCVECEWESVATDLFDANFRLIINPKHEDYQFIDRKSKTYCGRLENEIMAEALAEFLSRVLEDPEFKDGSTADFAEGTVGAIAQYMIETKGIVVNSHNESVLHQIVTAFEKGAE